MNGIPRCLRRLALGGEFLGRGIVAVRYAGRKQFVDRRLVTVSRFDW